MDEPRLERLPRFSTIGLAEKINISKALSAPLSGYLGGINKAGYWVTTLQERWQETFNIKYAVACNSATSGLLAACMAIGIKPGSKVWTSSYSMSATAACAKVLGADIVFIDIETIRFSMNMNDMSRMGPLPDCVIITNLFGHPAYLSAMRSWCDSNKVWMIEDNAQSPFAMENKKYAGTVGHIGVFSFNVHKHIQSGEGGVIVTNDNAINEKILQACNHGELADGIIGLNLRMVEPTAAIACAQLAKARGIIAGRIELAEELTNMVRDIPWITPPIADVGCVHVYYIWAALVLDDTQTKRYKFIKSLNDCGFPMIAGYSKPLHGIFTEFMSQSLPVVERVEYKQIITFEICAYNPKKSHLKKMREIIKKTAGDLDGKDTA